MKIYPPIAVDEQEYTVTPLVDPETPITMTDEETALYRAWDALQAIPSYCDENARQFAQEGK